MCGRQNIRSGTVKLMGGLLSALLLVNILLGCGMQATAAEPENLYAAAAVLMDADSGRVLFEKDGNRSMAMASTTKIMTCILVLEEGNLEDKAEVSAYAASMPKVKMYARKGEVYEVRSLLFSLMLESHNDAAVILAEYIGRDYLEEQLREKKAEEYTPEESKAAVGAFAKLMNKKAAELGCKDTWFITPNGLDATEVYVNQAGENVQLEHHTTACDLAKIMAYCTNQSPCRDVFREITRTQNYTFCENGRTISCVNHNAFLQMMEGAFSGKTGFTNKAGYCYVGALESDGRTFVIVLLACGWPNHKNYKWLDARTLFTYGVENFSYHAFAEDYLTLEDLEKDKIPVQDGQTKLLGKAAYAGLEIVREETPAISGILLKDQEKVTTYCKCKTKLEAPVYKGDVVGQIQYCVDDTIYITEKIVCKDTVLRIDFSWCMARIGEKFLLF